MEFRTPPVKNFMPKYQRYEPLILDGSAVTTFKECARKYFFEYVLSFKPRQTPPYFVFGTAYHKFREQLELRFVAGMDNSQNVKESLADALHIYISGLGSGPTLGTKFDFMTPERLQQSCIAAYKHWDAEKKKGVIKVIATEQPFCVELVPGSGEFTGGRVDQIVRWNGKPWGRDFKTSSKEGTYYARGLDPNDQFTRYTFAETQIAGERVQGQMVEVLYNSKKAGPTVSEYVTPRTDFQIADWLADELMVRKQMEMARNEDRYAKNERACAFCTFHSVCKMPTEGAQQAKLEAEFTVRIWDHQNPEGDS